MERALVLVGTPEQGRPSSAAAAGVQSPIVRFLEAVELRARTDAAKRGARAGGGVDVASLPLSELLADGMVAVCELVAQKLGTKLIDRAVLVERSGRVVDALLSFWIHEHFGDDVDAAVDRFFQQAVEPLWLALSLGLSPRRCLSFEDWKAVLAPLPANAGPAQQLREWRARIVTRLPPRPQPTTASLLAVLGAPVKIFLLNALRGARDSIEKCVQDFEALRGNNRRRIAGAPHAHRFVAVDVDSLAFELDTWSNYARFLVGTVAGTDRWQTYTLVKEMIEQPPLRRRFDRLVRLRAVVDSWNVELLTLRGVPLGDVARARDAFARLGSPFTLTEHGVDVLILEAALARLTADPQADVSSWLPAGAVDAALGLVRATAPADLVADVVAALPASVRRHADFAVLEEQIHERLRAMGGCRHWNELSLRHEISMLIQKLELVDALVAEVKRLNTEVRDLQERLKTLEKTRKSADDQAPGSTRKSSRVVDDAAAVTAPAAAKPPKTSKATTSTKKPRAR